MCAVLATSSKPLPSPPVTVSQPSPARVELEPHSAPLKNGGKNITAGANFGADVTRPVRTFHFLKIPTAFGKLTRNLWTNERG